MPVRHRNIAIVAAVILSLAAPVQGQCSGGVTLSTPAEARGLAANRTIFDRSVRISGDGAYNLTGITHILGDLTASFADGITEITSDDLLTVGRTLEVSNGVEFERIVFQQLQNVDTLRLRDLPNLRIFDPNVGRSGSPMLQNVSTVDIRRTGLRDIYWLYSLDSLSLTVRDNSDLPTLGSLIINNARLIDVSSDRSDFSVSFGGLGQAQNISIYGASSVKLPALRQVNESVSVSNSTLTKLDLPRLENMQKSFVMTNNSALLSLRLPSLSDLGENIILDQNGGLDAVNFQALEHIGRDPRANGSFTKLNFPALFDVHGNVFISSTADLDCAALDTFDEANMFKARYSCSANNEEDTLPPEDPETPSSSGLSVGAKAGIGVGVIVGVALLALGLYLLWRKIWRTNYASSAKGQGTQEWRKSELPANAKASGMVQVANCRHSTAIEQKNWRRAQPGTNYRLEYGCSISYVEVVPF